MKKIHYNHSQKEVLCDHWDVNKKVTKDIHKVTCQNCLYILKKIKKQLEKKDI